MGLRDTPIPEPQDDEVLIRVSYAGVNPADSKRRPGHWARAGYLSTLPSVPGMDAAGVVERLGRNVTEFQEDDTVVFWGPPDGKTSGSYAEFACVTTRCVSPMPESLNFRTSSHCSHCLDDSLSVSLPFRKRRPDPRPERSHKWRGGWC